jgi:hypothetical protein
MRKRNQLQVSLFPFLSILVCVIGTLTLLIAGLSLGAVGEDYRAKLDVLADKEGSLGAERSELERLLEEAARIASRLEAAREEAQRLEAGHAEAAALEGRIAELLDEIARVRLRHEELAKALGSVRWKLEQASTELADRRKNTRRVILQPGGSARGLAPRFVVCTETGIVVDPDRPEAQRRFVRTSDITSSRVYGRLLDEVKAVETRSVICVVRPGGVEAFNRAYFAARKAGSRFGYLPVPGDKEIDFSLFRRGGAK